MDRVIVTRPIMGIYNMQVCAAKDATEAEVLREANRLNPSGTEHGWSSIARDGVQAPVQCADDPNRTHYVLVC